MNGTELLPIDPAQWHALAKTDRALPVPFARKIPILESYVAGSAYRNLDASAPWLQPGLAVSLRREPLNDHDELAIQILAPDGTHLGYVPKSKNEVLAHLLDAGKCFSGQLTTVAWSGNRPSLNMKLFLEDF